MLDHSWIKSMQDELNQFKRLDVWKLVESPVGRNIIAVKWIWRHGDDILLVQIYVDDIIFGLTKTVFAKRFEKLMKDNFEMSMIGEMKFFLGLQVHQSPRGIFICQSQYTMDIVKKHGMEKCDTVSTSMATTKLDADLQVQLPYLAIRYNIQEQSTLTSDIILSKSMLRKDMNGFPNRRPCSLPVQDEQEEDNKGKRVRSVSNSSSSAVLMKEDGFSDDGSRQFGDHQQQVLLVMCSLKKVLPPPW
ncbi:retrovirus-related pol polyprotein from transposon TNT 1-94 [Tanacetum coccineum]